MKTLCAAVVALGLISACQPAPLTCEKLLKPMDKELDVTGTWYVIAAVTESCLTTTILNALLELSVEIHVNATDTPKVYNIGYNVRLYQYCTTDSEQMFYEKNKIFDVVNNNAFGDADVVLQSGCPDCLVTLGDSLLNSTLLLSRRKTVTAAELKEYEAQVACLGWSKPWVLETDHDYKNCKSVDATEDITPDDIPGLMLKRLETTYTLPLLCLTHGVLQSPTSVMEWFQELW